MVTKRLFIFAVLTAFLTGCISMPVISPIEPLEERVLEGEGRDKIAVIDISGLIVDKDEQNIFGAVTAPRVTARVREELDMAASDSGVKALLLRINSPGGSVTTSDIIYHELMSFKEETGIPVVAEMMEVAASGGYYIALAADTIYAHPTTVTGSVGVIAFKADITGLLRKIGISDATIKSGSKKDIGSPLRKMTGEERAILKGVIDSMHARFTGLIRERRPQITDKDFLLITDGRVFTSEEALGLGLIDSIGYLSDAAEAVKEAAGIEEARLIAYSRPSSYKANIYSGNTQSAGVSLKLLNIDAASLLGSTGVNFMYLWMP